MKNYILCLMLSILCFSCSSFTVTEVTDENRDSIDGLRFFLPKPYLLVAEKDLLVDGVKTVEKLEAGEKTTTQKMVIARKELLCSVIYLPDPQREFAIETLAGKSSDRIRIEDGWRLTGYNLPFASGVSEKQLGLLSGTEGLTPGIYAIEYQNSSPVLKRVRVIQ